MELSKKEALNELLKRASVESDSHKLRELIKAIQQRINEDEKAEADETARHRSKNDGVQ